MSKKQLDEFNRLCLEIAKVYDEIAEQYRGYVNNDVYDEKDNLDLLILILRNRLEDLHE